MVLLKDLLRERRLYIGPPYRLSRWSVFALNSFPVGSIVDLAAGSVIPAIARTPKHGHQPGGSSPSCANHTFRLSTTVRPRVGWRKLRSVSVSIPVKFPRSSLRVIPNRVGLTVHFDSKSTLAVNTFPVCSLYGSTQTWFAYAKTREKR
jgi:hypothetical protein